MEREIASIISNPDGFIEASSVMISVSCAILDDFTRMISIASGMKSVGEAVFSIPQMIIAVTAAILSVTDRLLSVPDQIVCGAARILSVTEIIISIRGQILTNQEHGGFAAIDNYFRDGNDFVRDGNDSLKDGKERRETRLPQSTGPRTAQRYRLFPMFGRTPPHIETDPEWPGYALTSFRRPYF